MSSVLAVMASGVLAACTARTKCVPRNPTAVPAIVSYIISSAAVLVFLVSSKALDVKESETRAILKAPCSKICASVGSVLLVV